MPVGLPALALRASALVQNWQARCMRTLQVLLFHRDACEAVAEEALIELCDW